MLSMKKYNMHMLVHFLIKKFGVVGKYKNKVAKDRSTKRNPLKFKGILGQQKNQYLPI